MNQLNQDFAKLQKDKYHRLTIYDKKFKRPLYKDFDYFFVVNNFQSFDNFIESIKTNGTKEITIIPRRANGSTTKSAGEPYDVVLVENSQPISTQTQLNFDYNMNNSNMSKNENLFTGGLGLNGMNGLMGADVSYRYMDYPKLESRVKELESENKVLKKENEQLSRENFKLEIEMKSDDKKRESNQQLIGMLAPALSPVLEKLMMPKIGLTEPAQLQPAQPHFDPQINLILNDVGILLTRSEDFYVELDDLIKKYGKNN